jgi:hypothetical protein
MNAKDQEYLMIAILDFVFKILIPLIPVDNVLHIQEILEK